MKKFFLPALLLVVAACCPGGMAQDRGQWRASSSNARTITGDILLTDRRIDINFLAFTIAQIRSLTPAEGSALFDTDTNVPGGGALYRLNVPANQRFQHHNTLCGTDDTQWMATYTQSSELHIAFFSGTSMPVLTFDALQNSTDRCGTFSYVR